MLRITFCKVIIGSICRLVSLTLMLMPLFMSGSRVWAADNMHFHGALTAQPCSVPSEDTTIPLDFGEIVTNSLYNNQRTPGKTLELNLTECDTQVADHVTLTFRGPESQSLPGLLALAPGSQAAGVAIGMEMTNGQQLPLNKPTGNYLLTDGDNVITLQVYVQGEPQAIAQEAIVPGNFSAIATFDLQYQ